MRRALAVAILIALPGAAHACAVCGAAVDRNKGAFFGTTILLSVLPVVLLGAGVWWVVRHAGGHLAAELADREMPEAAPQGPVGGAGS